MAQKLPGEKNTKFPTQKLQEIQGVKILVFKTT